MKLFDPHLHLDVLVDRVPGVLEWFVEQKVTPISWSYAYEGVKQACDLTAYFEGQCGVFKSLRKQVDCRYLVGVHPRNIPDDLKPEDIGDLLEPWITQSGCVGLGEIGIDTDDPREAEIFQAQVEWSAQLPESHIVGVHTPRANKTRVTQQILALLRAHAPRPERVLVDHCTADTLADVLDTVGFAGISLSPNKSSIDEAVALIQQHAGQCHRIMCNTDSAVEIYTQLTVLRRDDRLDETLRNAVLVDTARRAFRVP
jgi:predicted metal-dependent TIM-barrel fold hydrolase